MPHRAKHHCQETSTLKFILFDPSWGCIARIPMSLACEWCGLRLRHEKSKRSSKASREVCFSFEWCCVSHGAYIKMTRRLSIRKSSHNSNNFQKYESFRRTWQLPVKCGHPKKIVSNTIGYIEYGLRTFQTKRVALHCQRSFSAKRELKSTFASIAKITAT